MSDSTIGWEDVPGFGLQPSDEQLVKFYLKHKMLGYDNGQVNIFPTIDVCMHDPWNLSDLSILKNQPWHFYSRPKRKYRNSNKAERTTEAGYWKITGKDSKIMDGETQMQIGIKKTLVFYKGRFPNGERTNWVMNEYHPTFNPPNQRDLVLCKIKKKQDNGSSYEKGHESSSIPMSCDFTTGDHFANLKDRFSSLMSSNDDSNVTDQDEAWLQACMEELRGCFRTENYNVKNASQPSNQLQESFPYHDGTYNEWH